MTDKSVERSLISNTNREFIEYMDGQLSVNFFDFAPNSLKTATIKNEDGSITTNAVNMDSYAEFSDKPDYYFVEPKEHFVAKVSKICNFRNLTTTRVTQWVIGWAKSRSVEIDISYKRGSDAERCYRFIKWNSNFDQKKTENKSGDGWKPNPEFNGF